RVILAEGRADAELQHVSSLMTTSLEALRAYLEGERAYRVSAWDDARAAYERAVGYDSTFALAHLRAAQTIGWGDAGSAAVFRHQAAAQRFGERLPNREQALLAALSGVSRADVSALSEAEAAVRRYPDDPDLWNALGELQFHVGQKAMRPVEDALESLEQAASLAPDVAPYWIHIVDYQLSYGDSAAAAEALEQQRRLLKDTVESGIYLRHRAGFDLLHGDSASRAQALALIRDRTVYPSSAMRGPERLEASEAWWRALWEEEPRAGPRYATVLSDRGRMRAALALFPRSTQTGAMLRQTAVEFGFFPADSVRDLNWEGDEVGRAFSAISLQEPDAFARHRAALAEEVREWRERNPDSENGPGDFWLSFLDARWRWAMEGAAAVEDSVLAIYERSPTGSADYLLFMMGVLYDELGNDRAAFERYRAAAQTIPLAALRAARLADRLGDADEARRLYQELLIAWADADPEFQPWLEEARGWLERVPG
ncbi:MAG TPA: hypothetical protein VK837_10440, partial [Longimicrobiales bacterium]|nr:hypothetical protein [Longimicrobiales bacterium]